MGKLAIIIMVLVFIQALRHYHIGAFDHAWGSTLAVKIFILV